MLVLKAKLPVYYGTSLILPYVGKVDFDKEGRSIELDEEKAVLLVEAHPSLLELESVEVPVVKDKSKVDEKLEPKQEVKEEKSEEVKEEESEKKSKKTAK